MKIGSTPFFSSTGKHQSHHLVGCHAADINSLLISFLRDLCYLYLLRQVINLTLIIASGSPGSSRIPISPPKNVALLELYHH